jgi:hypothetical protein
MPFAKREHSGFIRAINYRAGEGKWTIVKRILVDDEWVNSGPIDISNGLEAILDTPHGEIGWYSIRKAEERPKGAPPVISLNVARLNGAIGKRPARGYQPGVRIRMLLSKEVGDESVRELLNTAACFWEAFGKFFDNHIEKQQAEHPGKLPLVRMHGTVKVPVQGGNGTVYAPQFELVGWVDRPEELADEPMEPIGSDWGGGPAGSGNGDGESSTNNSSPPKWHDDVPPPHTEHPDGPDGDEDLIPFT